MAWYDSATLPEDHILIGPDGLEHAFPTDGWGSTRIPVWSPGSLKQEGVNGLESRATCKTQPRYKFSLKFDGGDEGFLREEAMKIFVALFNQCRGSVYPLTLVIPNDCYVEGQQLGVGDNSQTEFPLIRTWGSTLVTVTGENPFSYTSMDYGFSDENFRKYGTLHVYNNGVERLPDTGNWTFDADTGIVTFSDSPGVDHIITADFYYAWRVRFLEDEYEFENFLDGVYSLDQIDFISVGRDE